MMPHNPIRPFPERTDRQTLIGAGNREPRTGQTMATSKQRAAARENVKKAAAAAKSKRTIAHLPKKTRTALGKEGAKAARRKRRAAR